MTIESILSILAGDDKRLRRLVGYWAATLLIYGLCVFAQLVQLRFGNANPHAAHALIGLITVGMTLLYLLVRLSEYLCITPVRLTICQGAFAIGCILFAYAINGAERGIVLSLFPVVILFGAFAIPPRHLQVMTAVAIVLLGMVMLGLSRFDQLRFPPAMELFHFVVAVPVLAATAALASRMSLLRLRLQQQKQDLADALERIELLATRDELTMLPNRRYMSTLLDNEERRQQSGDGRAALALIDIDHFKRINDSYGHAAGDQVLQSFAQLAQQNLRMTDVLARWGGEEFLLLFPDTGIDEAGMVLDRLRNSIAALRIAAIDPALQISFSAGLVGLKPHQPMHDAIRHADAAMYRAKEAGRNRVMTA